MRAIFARAPRGSAAARAFSCLPFASSQRASLISMSTDMCASCARWSRRAEINDVLARFGKRLESGPRIQLCVRPRALAHTLACAEQQERQRDRPP